MIVITRDINKASYNGAPVVTCNTCHQGSVHTRAMPSLEKAKAEPPAPEPQNAAQIAEAVAQYVKAAGGGREMKSLHVAGTIETDQFPGALNLEMDVLLPDRYRLHVTTPRGDLVQLVNGDRGWSSVAGTVTALRPSSLERTKRTFMLFLPIKPVPPDATRVTLDPQTGLLQRYRVESITPLGKLPYEIAFEDYRDTNGMKVPYVVHGTFATGRATYKISKIDIDPSIDPKLFEPPK